ncbi:MAG: UvrD-helicase domain-containing protein, partial [Acidimicrobiales bacterium]
HSFAQRLLTEHPVEAGLPPRVEMLDEVSSQVAFDQRWAMFQDYLLADLELQRTLLLLFASGVGPEALRSLAQAFDDNWDLVLEQVPDTEPDPPAVRPLFEDALGDLKQVCAEPCSKPDDKLALRLQAIASYIDTLAAIEDEIDLLEALGPDAVPKAPSFKVINLGQRPSFADIDDVRQRVIDGGARLGAVRTKVAHACARRIGTVIRRFTLDSAGERQRAGQLQFHDLLVFARQLLRDPDHGPAVRERVHNRYQRILLDEFQDTDPIQIELAVRIAAADPKSDAAGIDPWDQVEVGPGHLFVVGDPKQSIYRFRRADISTFIAAGARLGADGGSVGLTANFRTVAPIVEWVNAIFASLMSGPHETPLQIASQPRYMALEAIRPAPGVGPPLCVLGRTECGADTRAHELRAAEAAEVAATVTRIVSEGWEVGDGPEGWRPARLGDITVLVPARTSLPFLEDAFDEKGVPFRAESSSLVYASRAVRDLLMVLRAVDDPTNYLHIVSALRTPLLGCGDDDLFRFKWERKGRWSYLADQPDTVPADDPVRLGLQYLTFLYGQRHWLAPSEMLEHVARDRRALELGFTERRPRDVWRRTRFVIDQARAWSDATGGNLRQYLAWVKQQTSEGARAAEAILPESDDDAVRIMTIHSAKGLEFPVTIVSGMSTKPGGHRSSVEVAFPDGGVAYKLGKHVTTDEYTGWKPVDEQMDFHERIRLLYVACTRARDHLVVSLYRSARANAAIPNKRTNAELLVDGMGDLLDELPDGADSVGALMAVPPAPPASPMPFEAWSAERTATLDRASRLRAVAATALTDEGGLDAEGEPDPGLQKRPRDLDLPPWLRGRYGEKVGRAVHGVLQNIDLATGAGLESAVSAQCEAEAVNDRSADVQRLVLAALGSPSVSEAALCPHWREVYVCTPVDGRLLEGYIDLLYRSADGLVVVDYKTANTSDPAELDRRVEGYRNQGASYALAVAATTGEPVVRVLFLFLTPDGAVERELPDFLGAVEHVRQLVRAGAESVVA